MKKKSVVLSLLCALVLFLAACGSSSSNSGTSSPQPSNSPSPSASSAQPEAPKTILDEIKERGYISFAMGGKYPPFNFMNTSNELEGFDVDIAKEIAKRLGVEARFVTSEWEGLIPGLLSNKFDVILASMAITEERLQKVNFVHYYTSGAAIIVPQDSTIAGASDLNGVNIGVGQGTTYEKKAIELGGKTTTYSASADALADMMNGRVEAVISDKLLSTYAINTKNYPFKVVGDLLYDEKCGIAIRKEDTALQDEIQKIITEMQADGTYEAISKNWFGIDIR